MSLSQMKTCRDERILECAEAWREKRMAAIEAPMGDKQVWKDLADAEAELSAAVALDDCWDPY